MKKLMGIPGEEGYSMPGEFEPHRGCIMIWPKRPGSWNYGAVKAREAFKNVAHAIAESEDVYMLAEPDVAEDARRALGVTGEAAAEMPGTGARIHVLEMGSDDAWARDVGPTFVKNRAGDVRGIDWEFNAWGGTVDGLYAHWEKDDQVAERFCEALGYECYEAHPFVLEGGSIHSDGQGTILVTESCLLSGGIRSLRRRRSKKGFSHIWEGKRSSGCPGGSITTRPTSMWIISVPSQPRAMWYWPGPMTRRIPSMSCPWPA